MLHRTKAAQFIFRRCPTVEFLFAAFVAGRYYGFRWSNLVHIIKALRTKGEVPWSIAYARWQTCVQCPIFYAALSTCGTPIERGDEYKRDGKPMGCMCHMRTKVQTLSNCWAYDEFGPGADVGWPQQLNSNP